MVVVAVVVIFPTESVDVQNLDHLLNDILLILIFD